MIIISQILNRLLNRTSKERKNLMPDIAYVNGKFVRLSSAKISIEDRGYQFGDGIYEVIKSYNGKIFYLEEHLNRLLRSAKAIELDIGYPIHKLRELVDISFKKSKFQNAKIYLQITRGVASRSHPFPKDVSPSIVITVREIENIPEDLINRGIDTITLPDIRWGRCDIKSLNLLPNVLAKQKAKERGAFEAIFVKDRIITESSASNIFAVIDNCLITHPKDNSILHGITRDIIIQLANDNHIRVVERKFIIEEMLKAEEVFITGTTIELLSVVKIDGLVIGKGKPGDIYKFFRLKFTDIIES
ncbi:MAG: D-amino-acid transaminase [Nitrospirota bacterium]